MIPKNKLALMIDHTLLKSDASPPEIIKLCEEAVLYGFGAVCINPFFIPVANDVLKNTNVKICTVIGFPLGATLSSVKLNEAKEVIALGVDELDMVINISALKNGQNDYVKNEISQIVSASKNIAAVKVILETCYLDREEIIRACMLSRQAGACFVKTSTGFGPSGANTNDVILMSETVGKELGIKASGGIRTYNDALRMITAGATRLGTSSGIKIINELEVLTNG